ncbi:hypothetical protein PF010_g23823 [Phytophthora fragariae]|uniref:Pectate lyase n=1 Tax=Phytophthora fragariae TaxID=53985 RepID=A0A6G0K4C8_9STRA|nr:hypothetical protein PF010_g23823 [Phytophthora fragariae]
MILCTRLAALLMTTQTDDGCLGGDGDGDGTFFSAATSTRCKIRRGKQFRARTSGNTCK